MGGSCKKQGEGDISKNVLVGKLERDRRPFQPITVQLGHLSNNSKVYTENVLAKRYKGNKSGNIRIT